MSHMSHFHLSPVLQAVALSAQPIRRSQKESFERLSVSQTALDESSSSSSKSWKLLESGGEMGSRSWGTYYQEWVGGIVMYDAFKGNGCRPVLTLYSLNGSPSFRKQHCCQPNQWNHHNPQSGRKSQLFTPLFIKLRLICCNVCNLFPS